MTSLRVLCDVTACGMWAVTQGVTPEGCAVATTCLRLPESARRDGPVITSALSTFQLPVNPAAAYSWSVAAT